MKRIWQRLQHNFGLKIISLCVAVLLWSFVISDVDPERTRTYTKTIDVLGISALNENGLDVKGDISAIFDTAEVEITLKYSELNSLNAEAVGLIADLSGISEPGTYEIPLTAHTAVGSIKSIRPSSILVTVEEQKTTTVSISVETTGTLPDGLYASAATITPGEIEVTGAASDIALIQRAVIKVDLSQLTEHYTATLPVELLDSTGDVISYRRFFETQPTAEVSLQIDQSKQVEIDLTDAIADIDSLPAGYRVASITADPAVVRIIGTETSLQAVSSLGVQPVELNGQTGTIVLETSLVLPPNITAVEVDKIQLTVAVEKVE